MHEDNQGRLRGISGNLVKSISHDLPSSQSLLPKYTSVDALHFAKQVYSINTNITTDASLYENEKSELVIYIDDTQTAQLVYYVNFYTDSTAGGQPARPYFLIDAQSLSNECSCTHVRFREQNTDTKMALSILLSAKVTNQKVRIDLLDEGNCDSAYRVYLH